MAETENYIFPSVINGINQRLGEAGYSAAVQFTSGHVLAERQLLKHVLSEDYAGLLIEPAKSALPNINLDLYRKLSGSKPTIFLRARFDVPHISSVTLDEQDSGYQLTRCLLEQGHREIACFCKMDEQIGMARYHGYLRAFAQSGAKLTEENVLCFVSEDLPYLFGHPIHPRTLSILKRCTAAICQDDRLACSLHSFASQQHISLAIAGFDHSNVTAPVCCAAISHPLEEFGRTAADCLLRKIKTPTLDTSVTFPPRLILQPQANHRRLSF